MEELNNLQKSQSNPAKMIRFIHASFHWLKDKVRTLYWFAFCLFSLEFERFKGWVDVFYNGSNETG